MRFTHPYAAAAVAFFLRGVPLTDARTPPAKRWMPSDPKAFETELSFDPVGRYVATIGMVRCQINLQHSPLTETRTGFPLHIYQGRPWARAGNFSFLLSTSSPYTGVAAVGCETCAAQMEQAPMYAPAIIEATFR